MSDLFDVDGSGQTAYCRMCKGNEFESVCNVFNCAGGSTLRSTIVIDKHMHPEYLAEVLAIRLSKKGAA